MSLDARDKQIIGVARTLTAPFNAATVAEAYNALPGSDLSESAVEGRLENMAKDGFFTKAEFSLTEEGQSVDIS